MFVCLALPVYLWLSHQLNLKNTILSERADMAGFSKALLAIRHTWSGKYGRHDINQERFATVSSYSYRMASSLSFFFCTTVYGLKH